jgi:hypothetical protein
LNEWQKFAELFHVAAIVVDLLVEFGIQAVGGERLGT